MPLTALVRQLQQVPLTGEVLERSRRPDRLRLQGASRGARALLASAMARCEGAPLLVVVPTLEEAGRYAPLTAPTDCASKSPSVSNSPVLGVVSTKETSSNTT